MAQGGAARRRNRSASASGPKVQLDCRCLQLTFQRTGTFPGLDLWYLAIALSHRLEDRSWAPNPLLASAITFTLREENEGGHAGWLI
jgi:hypothetical protein